MPKRPREEENLPSPDSKKARGEDDQLDAVAVARARAQAIAAAARLASSAAAGGSTKQETEQRTLPSVAREEAEARKRETLSNFVPAASKSDVNPYLSTDDSKVSEKSTRDPRIPLKSKKRDKISRKGLQFVEEGKYSRAGEAMRVELEEKAAKVAARRGDFRPVRHGALDRKMEGTAEKESLVEGVPANPSLEPFAAALGGAEEGIELSTVPDIEWWDVALLPLAERKERRTLLAAVGAGRASLKAAAGRTASGGIHGVDDLAGWDQRIRYVTLVEHPTPVKPAGAVAEATRPRALPLQLTKKERRKKRHQTRVRKAAENQLAQRLGLIEHQGPKLRARNLARTKGAEVTLDPTAVDVQMREQKAEREMVHEASNLAKKLTPAERYEKRIRRMRAGAGRKIGAYAALFRIADLTHPRHRFKIHAMARRAALAGICLIIPDHGPNLVLVSGGQRGIHIFSNAVLRNIPWAEAISYRREQQKLALEEKAADAAAAAHQSEEESEEYDTEDESDEEELGAEAEQLAVAQLSDADAHVRAARRKKWCELVWRGTLSDTILGDSLRFDQCSTTAAARKLLDLRGLGSFWDAVYHSHQSLNN